MKIFRSIAAVVAGYLVFAMSAALLFQLAGRNPHADQSAPFMAVAAAYGMLFAALGGLLAARLSPTRPARHATAVSILIALGAAVSLIMSPAADARWSQWEALVLMAPCAVLASKIRIFGAE